MLVGVCVCVLLSDPCWILCGGGCCLVHIEWLLPSSLVPTISTRGVGDFSSLWQQPSPHRCCSAALVDGLQSLVQTGSHQGLIRGCVQVHGKVCVSIRAVCQHALGLR